MIDQLEMESLAIPQLEAYLHSLDIPGVLKDVTALDGGVSSTVLGIDIGEANLVLKQSLGRLKVRDDWTASRGRAGTEASALRQLGVRSAATVPTLVAFDPAQFVTVMQRAPSEWRTWKQLLFAGEVNPLVGATLGRLLASWQREELVVGDASVIAASFRELRIDPFYRRVAERHPGEAALIQPLVDELENVHDVLVHGDFSPKNILVGPGAVPALWVLDWEVAHNGTPSFDLAFLLCHLLLKSIARPTLRSPLRATALAFADSYDTTRQRDGDWAAVFAHVGCLLVARVDGKSPVEYLDPSGQASARALGLAFLHDPPPHVDSAWDRVTEGIR